MATLLQRERLAERKCPGRRDDEDGPEASVRRGGVLLHGGAGGPNRERTMWHTQLPHISMGTCEDYAMCDEDMCAKHARETFWLRQCGAQSQEAGSAKNVLVISTNLSLPPHALRASKRQTRLRDTHHNVMDYSLELATETSTDAVARNVTPSRLPTSLKVPGSPNQWMSWFLPTGT